MHGLYYEIKCLDSHPSLNVFSLIFSYYFFVFTWLYYLNIHSRGPHNVQNKDKLLVDLFFHGGGYCIRHPNTYMY